MAAPDHTGRPIDIGALMADDALIDALGAAHLDLDPILDDGCGGRLIRLMMRWRRWAEIGHEPACTSTGHRDRDGTSVPR